MTKLTVQQIRNAWDNAQTGGHGYVSIGQYVRDVGALLTEIDARDESDARAESEGEQV